MTTRRPSKMLVATLLALALTTIGGSVWALIAKKYRHAGVVTASEVFHNEAGSMMVVVDSRGQSLYVHDGVFELGTKKPKGGNNGTDLPDPGSPWGVCGGDTNISCESGYFQQSCKKDGVEGIQTCAAWSCHCLGSDGGYMAQSTPVCNACVPAADVKTPAETLPAF